MDCPRCRSTDALGLVVRPKGTTDIECLRQGCDYAVRHDLQNHRDNDLIGRLRDRQDYIGALLWVCEVSKITRWHQLFLNLGLAKWLHNRGMYSHFQPQRLEEIKYEYYEYLNDLSYHLGDALQISSRSPGQMLNAWSELIDLLNGTEPFDIQFNNLVLETSQGKRVLIMTELHKRIFGRQVRKPPYEDVKAMNLVRRLIEDTPKQELSAYDLYRELSTRYDMDVPTGAKLFNRLNNLLAALSYGPGELVEQLWMSVSDLD